ncbi:hypothetical protein RZS08_47810, partial [Arthrospira platensis SPKY1]|nr:hypothetical protein [Arthrospira platensis SPKY1]
SDSGTVTSFELIDYTGGSPVSTVSSAANVPIQNNDVTYLTALTAVNFTPVEIVTENMEPFQLYTPVELQLEAEGGSEPYFWYLQSPYDTINSTAMFPVFNGQQLTPSNT